MLRRLHEYRPPDPTGRKCLTDWLSRGGPEVVLLSADDGRSGGREVASVHASASFSDWRRES